MKKVHCILLIDDNPDDNFFHERVIRTHQAAERVLVQESASEALEFLQQADAAQRPDLIFLDINMPGMNGWEFLEEYRKLDKSVQSSVIVVMLTTSNNPDDKLKAESMNIACDFKTKPLTAEMLEEIIEQYCN